MKITRLGWAGLEIEVDGAVAVIDLLEDGGAMRDYVGEARTPLPRSSRTGDAALALVTHLHADHCDPAAVARVVAPDGLLLRPEAMPGELMENGGVAAAEGALARLDVSQRVVSAWETVEVGPFRATAVPAVDGFGDPQVGWVLEAGGVRILHAGDTLFHGSWWLVPLRLGSIDVAFLPVNGPIVQMPHRQPPSPLPAAMTPREAAIAARLLGAELAVPIHFDTFERAPVYVQVLDPAAAFLAAAEELGVRAELVESGQPVPALPERKAA